MPLDALAAIEADFKTFPYWHQLREFELSCDERVRALLWQMRTGKTKVVIDTACHLFLKGEIDAVLIVAPNGVHDNWIRRELSIHHWDSVPRDTWTWKTDVAGEAGEKRVRAHERKGWREQHDAFWERAKRVLATDRLAWFSVASETMIRKDVRNMVARIVRRKKGRILLVVDESHDFGVPGSKRSMMAMALAKKCAYRRILTGTALENSPLRAWSQYELLEPGALGFATYGDFKAHHAVYELKKNWKTGNSYPVLDSYRNLDELRERMARYSSVVLREDCEDLPDIIPSERQVELTEEILDAYRKLHHDFEIDLGGDEPVSIGENTNRLIKLQQVLSGWLKDEYGDVHSFSTNPRLDALVDEVELVAGKVIVWCAFHEDMDRVSAALRARDHEVVEYHGRVSDAGKLAARQAFEPGAQNEVKALVGFPTAGLDLSEAEKIVWYSHTFDAVKRVQANERATKMGGRNIPVVSMVAGGMDSYVLGNLDDKRTLADALTREGMKAILEKVRI